MLREAVYIIFGYLCGSVLFARVMGQLFHQDVVEGSKDQNPGTANAFMHGGFFCGILTLMGDLLKGALPVQMYLRTQPPGGLPGIMAALVLAAPVAGHIWPALYRFRGGKGIATTFGVLLGLIPEWRPVLLLAGGFILFSIGLCVTPHFARTVVTYLVLPIALLALRVPGWMVVGVGLICCMVLYRMHESVEEREPCRVHLLWRQEK